MKTAKQLEALRAGERAAQLDDKIQMRVSAERKRIYVEEAEAAGLTLSAWITERLDESIAQRQRRGRRTRA